MISNGIAQVFIIHHKKGQATTELAIFGSLIIMILAYLVQTGFVANAKQALEMYTFREALKLSFAHKRGITLTVIRNVVTPSFFSTLSRQPFMATTSVDTNCEKLYLPENAQDVSTYQLMQIGETMIRNEFFFAIPRMKVWKRGYENEDGDADWSWDNAIPDEIDYQENTKTSKYNYSTAVRETSRYREVSKAQENEEIFPVTITFKDRDSILDARNIIGEDGEITDVDATTIPHDVTLTLNETIRREKRGKIRY